ncbi:NAD-dependent epimerase/dehydratase family protein [Chryseobacterium lineare]
MIIGNGMLANALSEYDRDDVVFFASGVSNSQETNSVEFEREISLLKYVSGHHKDKKLVYFSTCSIYDISKSESPYVQHKINMELLISENSQDYSIFRIGNAVGRGGNPNTLINFLKNAIETNKEISLHKNAGRILVGADDIADFVHYFLKHFNNQYIDFAYPYQYKPLEIISRMEKYLGKKANYEIIDEGALYNMEFDVIVKDYFKSISPSDYLDKIFNSYL